jgi:hypothetical protein
MVKRREEFTVEKKNFIPRLKDMKSWRNGNKVSRFFRHMFEHENLHKVLGRNLAVAAIAGTMLHGVLPASASNFASGNITVNMSTAPLVLNTEHGIQEPLSSMHINQGYFSYHPGIDLKGTIGDPIHPIMVGTVVEAGYSHVGYGNVVMVNHGGGIETVYAHMSKIFVKTGDAVNLDSVLGLIGSTGHSTGPHLHLEVRENGSTVNPLRVLPAFK